MGLQNPCRQRFRLTLLKWSHSLDTRQCMFICVFYVEFRKMILFPANFNLPVFTKANMNAFVAAPKPRRFLRSCSSMAGSRWSEIKTKKQFWIEGKFLLRKQWHSMTYLVQKGSLCTCIQVTSKAEVTFCHLLNLLPLAQNLGHIAKLKDMKLCEIKLIIKLTMSVTK